MGYMAEGGAEWTLKDALFLFLVRTRTLKRQLMPDEIIRSKEISGGPRVTIHAKVAQEMRLVLISPGLRD